MQYTYPAGEKHVLVDVSHVRRLQLVYRPSLTSVAFTEWTRKPRDSELHRRRDHN